MPRDHQTDQRDHPASTLAGIGVTGLMLILASLLTLLSAPGCSGGSDPESMTVEITADGVVRVTHTILPDQQLPVDTLAVWNLWREDSGYIFNSIAGIAGSAEGLFIIDRGNRELVQVDLQGRYRSHFGRSGEGPGEFQFPHVIVRNEDELWIADIMNRRFSVYSTTGEYLRDTRWGSYSWHEFFPLGESDLLINTRTNVDFDNADEIVPPLFLLRVDIASGEEDTLTTMAGLREMQIEVRSVSGQAMIFVGPPQFAPRLHWSYSPDSGLIHLVCGSEYRIEVRDLSGRLLREVLAPAPDLTVTQADRDWFFDDEFRFGFGSGERFTATRASLEKYPFAERRQAIEGVTTDPFGRVWILAATDHPGTTRLDLYAPDGAYLGHLGATPLPTTFTPDGSALIRIEDAEDADLYLVISVPVGTEVN